MLAAAMVVPETQRRHPSGFGQAEEAECGIFLAKARLGAEDFGILRTMLVCHAVNCHLHFVRLAPQSDISVCSDKLGYDSAKGDVRHWRDEAHKGVLTPVAMWPYMFSRGCLFIQRWHSWRNVLQKNPTIYRTF